MQSIIDDYSLASAGEKRQKWYREQMVVLESFKRRFEIEKPFLGMKIVVCMHCEPKGAIRTEVLLAGGASEIVFIGNLGSTKPDTAAYLASLPRVTVLAKQADTLDDLNKYVALALSDPADLFMDNGASLMQYYNSFKPHWKPRGGIEETRSGQLILDEQKIDPAFPLIVIDDSLVKRLIENEVGVGQSVVDGFMRATSMVLGGKKILIIGYGYCGKGIAQRFRAMGAITMVYDTDPLCRLKAKIEGHITGTLSALLRHADAVVTVTGRNDIIGPTHVKMMKDRAILFNAGHYNMEISVQEIENIATRVEIINDSTKRFSFDEKSIYLLQDGNPINLSAAAGNPIEIMEVGYALQLLSLEELLFREKSDNGIYAVPEHINTLACEMCLDAWGNFGLFEEGNP